MWLTALSALGLLLTSVPSQSCPEDSASWVQLKPLDRCKDGENTCLYSITLPPLTVQLPRSVSELERIVREVHDLRETVNQLREECRECRERHRWERTVQPGDGESGGNIQAFKGVVNVREAQQDTVNRVRNERANITQSAEHESMVIRPVTEIKDPAAFPSLEKNDKPSAGRHTPVVIKGGKRTRILEAMSRFGKVPLSRSPDRTPKPRPEPRQSKGQTTGQGSHHEENISGNRTTSINSVSVAEITEGAGGEDEERKQTSPPNLNEMDTRLHMSDLNKHNHKLGFNVTMLEDKGIVSHNRFKDSRKVHVETYHPASTHQDVRTMNNQTDYGEQNPAGSDTKTGIELESHRVYTVKGVKTSRSPSSVHTTADVGLKNPPDLETKSSDRLKSAVEETETETSTKPGDVDASGSNNLSEADQMDLQRLNDEDTVSRSQTPTWPLSGMRVQPTGETKVNLPSLRRKAENAPESDQDPGRASNSAGLKTSGDGKPPFVAGRRNLTASRPSSEEIRRFFLNRRRMNQSRSVSNSRAHGGDQETSGMRLTNGQHRVPSSKREHNLHRPRGLLPFRAPDVEQNPGVIQAVVTELVPITTEVPTSSKRPYVQQKGPEYKSVPTAPKTSRNISLKSLSGGLNTSSNGNTKMAPSSRDNGQGGGTSAEETGNEHNGYKTVTLQTKMMNEREDQATFTETPTIMERLPVRMTASGEQGPYRTYTSRHGEESERLSIQRIDDHSNKDSNPGSRSFSEVPVLTDKVRTTASLDGPADRYRVYRKPINTTEHGPLKNHTNVLPVTQMDSFIIPSEDTDPKKQGPKKTPTPNSVEVRGLETQPLDTCNGDCGLVPAAQPPPDEEPSNPAKERPPQDCSDFTQKNLVGGIYTVTPTGLDNSPFSVLCDTQASGGGWTVIQRRVDGTVSFNRTWDDYKKGFGNLSGEFWLGNDKLHRLTAVKAMVLRIELEDLEGIKEHAQYERFHVASENERYRLTIRDYSGTAGNAMQYNKKFNHDQKFFSTPDRDNDHYSSGNCGAYYSSGWWFDACMAANLNGMYHQAKYKGIRKGIFWGTWHNITMESYPTNYRQAFRTVRMMIRPRTGVV